MGVRALLLVFLVFLAACEPALQTRPTSEYQLPEETSDEPVNLCADVSCNENEECYQGDCICEEGYKTCNNTCIPDDQCCTTDDCAEGTCEQGICVQDCHFGETFEDNACDCGSDRKYCPEQDRCIPRDACCVHSQCDRDQRCVPVQLRARLCLETDNKTKCRLLADNGRDEVVAVNNVDYRLEATNWWNDNTITFTVNNETIRLDKNDQHTLANIAFYYENFEEVGGYCKEDVDDD